MNIYLWLILRYGLGHQKDTFIVGQKNIANYTLILSLDACQVLLQLFDVDHLSI